MVRFKAEKSANGYRVVTDGGRLVDSFYNRSEALSLAKALNADLVNPDFKVGDWAHYSIMSDCYPVEVVAVTPTTVTTRDMRHQGHGDTATFTPNPNGRVRKFVRARKPNYRGDRPYRPVDGFGFLGQHARYYQAPEV
jgi:hypothetical protein